MYLLGLEENACVALIFLDKLLAMQFCLEDFYLYIFYHMTSALGVILMPCACIKN